MDTPRRYERLLTAATLLIEAFVVLHFLGVIPFLTPALSLALFLLAGVAFMKVRRAFEAVRPPVASSAVPMTLVRPRYAKAVVLGAILAGLLSSLLVQHLAK
jgi:hypothetical protein